MDGLPKEMPKESRMNGQGNKPWVRPSSMFRRRTWTRPGRKNKKKVVVCPQKWGLHGSRWYTLKA